MAHQVVACLIAGFVATVLVAWLIAAVAPFHPVAYESRGESPKAWQPDGEWSVRANVGMRFGVTHWNIVGGATSPDDDAFTTNVLWSGWPVRALESRRIWDHTHRGLLNPDYEQGVPLPDRFRAWAMKLGYGYQSNLPVLPLRGLLIDVIVWGLVCFTMHRIWRWWRAHRRERRGLCRRCTYARGGLTTCPECGCEHAVPPRAGRRGVRIAIYLAAGLAISLIVAVASAWMPIRHSGWTAESPGRLRQHNHLPVHMSIPASWREAEWVSRATEWEAVYVHIDRGIGHRNEIASTHFVSNREPGPPLQMRMRSEVGWPWTALVAESDVEIQSGRTRGSALKTGVPLASVATRDFRNRFDVVPRRRLPLFPAWTLIANVIFWSAVAWMVVRGWRCISKQSTGSQVAAYDVSEA